jgi:hypothetical protein
MLGPLALHDEQTTRQYGPLSVLVSLTLAEALQNGQASTFGMGGLLAFDSGHPVTKQEINESKKASSSGENFLIIHSLVAAHFQRC